MFAIVLTAEAAKAETGGFAPLETWHYPSQIFWLVVLFSFLYLSLSRFILPRIGSTLERRESNIASELDEAATMNDKAVAAQKQADLAIAEAHAKARQTAAQARTRIEADIAQATEKADIEADKKLAAAEARISGLRQDAMQNVEQIASEATQVMLAKFNTPVSDQTLRKAIKSVIEG